MSTAPRVSLDLAALVADPYPQLARLQAETPIAYVPALQATLITRRNVIFEQEKRIEVFSSHQPGGLMVTARFKPPCNPRAVLVSNSREAIRRAG